MAEPAHAARPLSAGVRRDPERAPLDAADFPGCRAVRIAPEEIEDYDGRLEYWEARSATAMVLCEPTSLHHEQPSQRLARLAERIAASRGSPIETFGTADLVRRDARGKPRVLMQADQILYLHPRWTEELPARVDVDGGGLPDVVLEVDHSTDVRVRKLPLYEAWGFPEVWVDVPDARSASRPKSRLPGLTIHVLDGGRFRTVESSRAFPGWTAEEIHRALNEPLTPAVTVEALHRVGAALGAAEGTGPDDDPWLRRYRTESRVEGRAEGRAEGRVEGRVEGRAEGRVEGRVEGRAEGRYESVLAVLAERGIAASPDLPARIAELGALPVAETVRAALRCESESDFLKICAAGANRHE